METFLAKRRESIKNVTVQIYEVVLVRKTQGSLHKTVFDLYRF